MLTPDGIRELWELHKAGTQGEWWVLHGDIGGVHLFIETRDSESGQPTHRYLAAFDAEEDEALVAAARNALPELLREIAGTRALSGICERPTLSAANERVTGTVAAPCGTCEHCRWEEVWREMEGANHGS